LDIAWSSDNTIIISGSIDNSVIVWNVHSGFYRVVLNSIIVTYFKLLKMYSRLKARHTQGTKRLCTRRCLWSKRCHIFGNQHRSMLKNVFNIQLQMHNQFK